MYKLIKNSTSIVRIFDGATIPIDLNNADYQGYLKWVGEGNVPFPFDEPTLAERKADKQSEIDALEASQYMTRGEREGWLMMFESKAAAQSVSLETLYGVNPFYKKLKDVNDQVTVLRAELKEIV